MAAPKVAGLMSRAWAPGASFVLHGAVVMAVFWALREPPSPANTAMHLIAMEFAAPPAPASTPPSAPVAAAAIEPLAAEPLTVETVPPSSATVTDVPPVVESLSADVPKPPAAKPRPKVEQRPAPKAEPKPQVKPVNVSAPADQKAQPTDAVVSAEAAVTLPNAVLGPSAAAPQQAMAAPPADYVGLLRQQLERNKVYPRSAQQRRQQGSAMVRIAIDRGGQVLSFKIEQSSGHELLDREVVAMVQRASPLPPIPAGLNTDRLEVVVPVEFFLR